MRADRRRRSRARAPRRRVRVSAGRARLCVSVCASAIAHTRALACIHTHTHTHACLTRTRAHARTQVVASTSGNTGAAIAMMAAMRGYKYIAITNKKCSEEKRDSMRAYGGELIVAADGLAADHPEHYVNLEATLCARNKG